MKLFLKNLLFTVLVPGLVYVYLPLFIVHNRAPTTLPGLFSIGILAIILGAAIYTWTVWDFASYGSGTPLPIDAPKKLVVRGLYRYVRNPMYLGVILIILGWSAIYAYPWLLVYALGVWIVMDLFVVAYEEPRLRKLFGDDYVTYRVKVGRWVPNVHRNHFLD